MDDISKVLGRAVLVTPEIANIDRKNWINLGDQDLAGIAEPVELYARVCEIDAFEAQPDLKRSA